MKVVMKYGKRHMQKGRNNMGGKYSVLARDYEERVWSVALYTNSRFTAIKVWIKALFRYELVEFTVRK
jgi:hypothetical protein